MARNITMTAARPAARGLAGLWLRAMAGLLALSALGFGGVANAQQDTPALQDVSFVSLPGERVRIQLKFSAPVPDPGSFTVDNPARIALDFPHTRNALPTRRMSIDSGKVHDLVAVEAGGRTRVVIGLSQPVGFDTKVEGDNVYLTLDSSAEGSSVATPGAVPRASVRDVDFRRAENGAGRVILTLTDPRAAVDMERHGQQIEIKLPKGHLPQDLERRLDVTDFGTQVKTIDAFNQAGGAKIVITAAGDFEHIGYQTDDRFIVEVSPKGKAKKQAATASAGAGEAGKPQYSGQRLSLNFQNIEVRAVLQLIADFTGLNMVTSDTVQGNLTLRLKNVPWDQALDIILKSKGLDMRRDGNVIMVAPAEEIAAREKLQLEAAKQLEELAPLRSRSIQVNYAKAADLAALLKQKGNSLLSERGQITVDPRTNKLLVQDTQENIDAIKGMVAELDVPVRQVLIESRVVLASNQFSKELGVRFGVSRATTDGNHNVIGSGNLEGTTQIINGQQLELNNSLNVNLPATSSAAGTLGLALAKLPLGTLIELELSAAQAEGRSETISSPRVITANQREATIETGTEIPYQEASASGATSVSFKKAVLSLKVTPQITPDDRIIMDLQVNKDAPNFGNAVLGVPPIDTQSVTTQVLVDNGETVVLGGVYQQTKTHTVNRIPFFGDLPVVGVLFRNKLETNDKSELLIFVTPKILKEKAKVL